MKLKLLLTSALFLNLVQASESSVEAEESKWNVQTNYIAPNSFQKSIIIMNCCDPENLIQKIEISEYTVMKKLYSSSTHSFNERVSTFKITTKPEALEAPNLAYALAGLTQKSQLDNALLYNLTIKNAYNTPQELNEKERRFSNFIKILYNEDFISDYVTTNLLEKLSIPEFRLDENNFLTTLNKKLSEESDAADFKNILNDMLKKAKNPEQRQKVIAMVVVNLAENEQDPLVIAELCQEVTNPLIPLFSQVKKIQADLLFINKSDIKFLEKNKQAISGLLDIKDNNERNELTTPFILNMLNGDVIPHNRQIPDLPEELKNIGVSKDYVVNLLMFMGKQAQELRELKSKVN